MTQIGIEQNPSLVEMLGVEPAREILTGIIEKFPEIMQRIRNFGTEEPE